MQTRNLPARGFLRFFWIDLEKAEQAAFAEHDQFSVRQDGGATAVNLRLRRRVTAVQRPAFVALPHQFAAIQLNATKLRVRLVAPAESVEVTVVIDRCVPMDFQHRAPPDLLETAIVRFHTEQYGTRSEEHT